MDPDKVKAILNAPAPSNAKALSQFLGQIRWHSRMIQHLADFATPLLAAVHRLEDKAYQNLKRMLSHAPVVQPPVWSEPFNVFVDASDVAIGSALMQCTPLTWYWPMYYASRRLSTTEKNYSTTEWCRENPSLRADRETEPPGFWTRRIYARAHPQSCLSYLEYSVLHTLRYEQYVLLLLIYL